MTKKKTMRVTIVAYPGMTMLDAIGPNDVLANSPHFDVEWVSTSIDKLVNDHANLQLSALKHYATVASTDILLIPGGAGDRALMQDTKFLAWVKTIDQTTMLTTAVCTGSVILAKTGLLTNHKACTHWACLNELSDFGAQPVRQRFVKSGKYITASGVSSGIDMALYIVKSLVSKAHARDLRFGIEYFPNQYHFLSSYSLPRRYLDKLATRFHNVFSVARSSFYKT